MKKILFLALGVAFVLSSCEKDSLGVSTVTTYPTIELIGDEALTIMVGGTYTEQGCIAMEGPEVITSKVVTEGTVDPSTPGVYTIVYTVANKDGFTTFSRRLIGVIDTDAAAMDISGNYKRNAGAQGIATVTKVAAYPGLYINNNPGGINLSPAPPAVAPSPIPIYMFHWTATKVGAPTQHSVAGDFACINGTYNDVTKRYVWTCINAGYGSSPRTFIKQ